MTVEEFLERPPSEDGFTEELIEGEIVLSPLAKPLHARIARRIRNVLAPIEAMGFEVISDFGCLLGKNSLLGPDVAVVRLHRLNKVEAGEYVVGAPELAIEVFSPSNRKAVMTHKVGLYLLHGAEAVWVVYPKKRTVLVYEGDTATEVRPGESLSFHGVTIPVDAIFEGL